MKTIKVKGDWDENRKQLAERIKVIERQNVVKERLVFLANELDVRGRREEG